MDLERLILPLYSNIIAGASEWEGKQGASEQNWHNDIR